MSPESYWADRHGDDLVRALLEESEGDGVGSYRTRFGLVRAAGEVEVLTAQVTDLQGRLDAMHELMAGMRAQIAELKASAA